MVSRRQALAGFGGFVLGTAVAPLISKVKAALPKGNPESWVPHKLDPEECAQVAYEGYWEEGRGCGFGAFKGIIGVMGTRYGEPCSSFPVWMMSYASAGIGKWGTVCGALNSAAAALGLFYEKKGLEELIDTLFIWYETTALPEFIPKNPKVNVEIKQVVTPSVLCHVTLSRWCWETGHLIGSRERAERCSRVVSDVARKAAELLNAKIDNRTPAGLLASDHQYCSKCHSEGKDADFVRGKMVCGLCHRGTLTNKFLDHSK